MKSKKFKLDKYILMGQITTALILIIATSLFKNRFQEKEILAQILVLVSLSVFWIMVFLATRFFDLEKQRKNAHRSDGHSK